MASVVKEPALIPAIAALFKKVEVSPEGASQATRTVIALPPGLARQIEDEFPLFQYDKDTLPPMPPLTKTLSIAHISDIVDSLGEKWEYLNSKAFAIIGRLLLIAEPCLARDQGLFRLKDILEDPQKMLADNTFESFKKEAGRELGISLYLSFIDSSRPPRSRRWIGLLLHALLTGSKQNLQMLKMRLSPVWKQCIGKMILESNDRIIKVIAVTVITVMLEGTHDYMRDLHRYWPPACKIVRDFPQQTAKTTGWYKSLFQFIDNLDQTRQMWETTGCISTTITVGNYKVESECTLVSITDYLSIFIPPRGNHRAQYVDVDVCDMDSIDIYNSESQSVEMEVDVQILLVDYKEKGHLLLKSLMPYSDARTVALRCKDAEADGIADALEKARDLARMPPGTKPFQDSGAPLYDISLTKADQRQSLAEKLSHQESRIQDIIKLVRSDMDEAQIEEGHVTMSHSPSLDATDNATTDHGHQAPVAQMNISPRLSESGEAKTKLLAVDDAQPIMSTSVEDHDGSSNNVELLNMHRLPRETPKKQFTSTERPVSKLVSRFLHPKKAVDMRAIEASQKELGLSQHLRAIIVLDKASPDIDRLSVKEKRLQQPPENTRTMHNPAADTGDSSELSEPPDSDEESVIVRTSAAKNYGLRHTNRNLKTEGNDLKSLEAGSHQQVSAQAVSTPVQEKGLKKPGAGIITMKLDAQTHIQNVKPKPSETPGNKKRPTKKVPRSVLTAPPNKSDMDIFDLPPEEDEEIPKGNVTKPAAKPKAVKTETKNIALQVSNLPAKMQKEAAVMPIMAHQSRPTRKAARVALAKIKNKDQSPPELIPSKGLNSTTHHSDTGSGNHLGNSDIGTDDRAPPGYKIKGRAKFVNDAQAGRTTVIIIADEKVDEAKPEILLSGAMLDAHTPGKAVYEAIALAPTPVEAQSSYHKSAPDRTPLVNESFAKKVQIITWSKEGARDGKPALARGELEVPSVGCQNPSPDQVTVRATDAPTREVRGNGDKFLGLDESRMVGREAMREGNIRNTGGTPSSLDNDLQRRPPPIISTAEEDRVVDLMNFTKSISSRGVTKQRRRTTVQDEGSPMLDNSHSDHSDLVKKYQESTLPEKIPENRPEGKAMAERVHTRTNFTIKGCSVNNELSQVTQLYDCSPESISIPPAQAELEDALINIPKLAVKAGLPRETATLRTPSPHLHMNYKMNNKIKTHNIGPYQNYQSDGFSKSQQVRKGQSVVLEKDPRTEICSRKFKKINQRARPHHGDPFQDRVQPIQGRRKILAKEQTKHKKESCNQQITTSRNTFALRQSAKAYQSKLMDLDQTLVNSTPIPGSNSDGRIHRSGKGVRFDSTEHNNSQISESQSTAKSSITSQPEMEETNKDRIDQIWVASLPDYQVETLQVLNLISKGLIKFLVSHEERVDNLAADFAAEGQKVVNKLKRKCEDDYNQFKFNLEDGRHRGRYIYQYVKKELNGIWGRGIPKAKKARFNI